MKLTKDNLYDILIIEDNILNKQKIKIMESNDNISDKKVGDIVKGSNGRMSVAELI